MKKSNYLEQDENSFKEICKNCCSFMGLGLNVFPCIENNCAVYYAKGYSHGLFNKYKSLIDSEGI